MALPPPAAGPAAATNAGAATSSASSVASGASISGSSSHDAIQLTSLAGLPASGYNGSGANAAVSGNGTPSIAVAAPRSALFALDGTALYGSVKPSTGQEAARVDEGGRAVLLQQTVTLLLVIKDVVEADKVSQRCAVGVQTLPTVGRLCDVSSVLSATVGRAVP